MSANLKRYNQGLWKLGPMEQCNDGEWVRYSEADELIKSFKKEYESLSDEFSDLSIINHELESQIRNGLADYELLDDRYKYLRRLSTIMAFLFGMLSVYIMFLPL